MKYSRAIVLALSALLAACANTPYSSDFSCPITEPVESQSEQATFDSFVVDATGDDHLQRFHWPRSEENDPLNPTIPNHPEMVVVYLKFAGEPNKALKPSSTYRRAKPVDLPIYEKLESFTIKFKGERYGPNCKLLVPIWEYPFMRNIDPSSLTLIYQADSSRVISDVGWFVVAQPVNYLKDQVFQISLRFGPYDPKTPFGKCANLDPKSGKPTYPLAGILIINFEGREPHYRISPDCQKWRAEEYGVD